MKYLEEKYKEKNTLKSILIIISIVFLITFSISKYIDYKHINKLENSIMAIDVPSGMIFKLNRENYTIKHRISEYKSHVSQFIRYWFQFDHNNFLSNLDSAKNYIDIDNYETLLNSYKSERIYERIQRDDIILHIDIDNIDIEYKNERFEGVFKITQHYRSQNFKKGKTRTIEGVFKIKDTSGRTDENAHGATIYDFIITNRVNQ